MTALLSAAILFTGLLFVCTIINQLHYRCPICTNCLYKVASLLLLIWAPCHVLASVSYPCYSTGMLYSVPITYTLFFFLFYFCYIYIPSHVTTLPATQFVTSHPPNITAMHHYTRWFPRSILAISAHFRFNYAAHKSVAPSTMLKMRYQPCTPHLYIRL